MNSNSYDQWMRHGNVIEVLEAAKTSEPARNAAVARIIDTMLEVQLDYSHFRPGWPPMSPTALACSAAQGEMTGGGYSDGDPMLAAVSRTWKDSWWHQRCAYLLSKLPARAAAAMLMQAARVRPMKAGVGNWWCKTNRELLNHQDEALQRLGLKGKGVKPFATERTMQLHAKAARKAMRAWIVNQEEDIYQKGKKCLERQTEYA